MGIQFLKQYAQAGLRNQIPLYSVYTVDEIFAAGGEGSPARRPVRDALLEFRESENEANQKVRGPSTAREYGKTPVFLRRPELRRHHADRPARPGGEGRFSQQKGMIAAMGQVDYKRPGAVQVQREPLPDPRNFLPPEGRAGSGRRARDADPADRLRGHKDSYAGECPDEVVGRPAWRR